MHVEPTIVNLPAEQRRVLKELYDAGWAICLLSPSFTGGKGGVRNAAETAMAEAGYRAVYTYYVGGDR